MSFKIVADSSSNLYSIDQYDYSFVPLKINCEGYEFIDDPNLDIAEMNQILFETKSRSGTSCPNSQEWLEAYDNAPEVFAVTITSNLSGSYAAAVVASEEYLQSNPNGKICVIDSLSTGPEMCLIIEKIIECDQKGMSFEETETAVREYAKHTHLLFSLKSMNNLARNGRISMAKAKLAGVLGIRAVGIASEIGTLQLLHKCRGDAKNLETILQSMIETGYKGARAIISHCFNSGSAEKLKTMIQSKFKDAKVDITTTGGLCSYYAENGGLLIGYECKGMTH